MIICLEIGKIVNLEKEFAVYLTKRERGNEKITQLEVNIGSKKSY
jgi:hypothetical protein